MIERITYKCEKCEYESDNLEPHGNYDYGWCDGERTKIVWVLKSDFENELNVMSDNQDRYINDLKREHKLEIKKLKSEHEEELLRVKKEIENEINNQIEYALQSDCYLEIKDRLEALKLFIEINHVFGGGVATESNQVGSSAVTSEVVNTSVSPVSVAPQNQICNVHRFDTSGTRCVDCNYIKW